jgi:glycine/D-amino acid oxidase-like deaminating enzyme
MRSIGIVGGGLFGQVIAKKLRKDGHHVLVFDSQEPNSGSRPSGGHLKPSWLSFLDKRVMDKAFETLSELYGLETLSCKLSLTSVSLYRVDVDSVINEPTTIPARVESVEDGLIRYRLLEEAGVLHEFSGEVIVAAGVWCAQLLPSICGDMKAKRGMSFTFGGVSGEVQNAIIPWAPYKQVVRTAHGPGRVWIGDGTALLQRSWSAEVEARIRQRVFQHVNFPYDSVEEKQGLRPFFSNGFQQLGPHLWLATGGGKSGMCLAAVYANKLSEILS